MASLRGKSLIVTGGASGIGEAAVLLAAEQGARLTVADMNESGARAVCEAARAKGAEAQFVLTDISDSRSVQALVATAVRAYGRLDAAFNNAGIPNANFPFLEMPDDTFSRMQAVNAMGVFLCTKYEAIEMAQSGGGAIVNTSSTAAVSTLPNMADYGAAKAGVLALTRSAALELGRSNIRVNAILPGPTRSKMFDEGMSRVPGLEDMLKDRVPLGRIASAREVANVALWLLSDDASIVTGVSMPADGGLTIL